MHHWKELVHRTNPSCLSAEIVKKEIYATEIGIDKKSIIFDAELVVVTFRSSTTSRYPVSSILSENQVPSFLD